MKALLKIGMEIGQLRGRLDKLEGDKDCNCKKGAEKETQKSRCGKEDLDLAAFLHLNQASIVEAINKMVEEKLISERNLRPDTKLSTIFVERIHFSTRKPRDLCCMCCLEGTYCCIECGGNCC